jgi:hypothetical protein
VAKLPSYGLALASVGRGSETFLKRLDHCPHPFIDEGLGIDEVHPPIVAPRSAAVLKVPSFTGGRIHARPAS